MSRPPQPSAPPDAPLALLNRLLAAFSAGPIAESANEGEFAAELCEAHALLVMLAPTVSGERATPEALAEVRHNWNKAVRRRGWRALPPLPSLGSGSRAQATSVAEFLALLGVSWDPATCSPSALEAAGPVAEELRRRLDALREPPLPSPERYAQELAAIRETWNGLADRHGLPSV